MRHAASAMTLALRSWRLLLSLAIFGAVAAAVVLLGPVRGLALRGEIAPAPDPSPGQQSAGSGTDSACLKCHGDPQLAMTFPSGEVLSLYLDDDAYRRSVHGDRLACVDCHQRNDVVPHVSLNVRTRRDLTLAEYEGCKRCHFENYTRTLDSMHFDAMAEGKENAPVCTDCHGAHTVIRLEESRTKIAQTCSQCHEEIYNAYQSSVHGSELEKDNPDVPVCITCHGVHNIGGAKTASFRQASVDLCAGCHANQELMSKYKISTDVFNTYLDDFHGKTVGFHQKQAADVWPDVAVCTDCHGVHDMKRVDDPDSSVIKENLVTTCRKCHPDASANFSGAWLSHYEPSMDKATLVYLIKQYYRFLIPAMVLGLALNIALDLWRLARNR